MILLSTRRSSRKQARKNQQRPTLRFTPFAWAKLLSLRDAGSTEVGGFGIASADDLLLVEDVRLVRQRCTRIRVEFDDAAVADYFDDCVDAGLPPERFARIWIHTHPGQSAVPSRTDECTFARVFGGCDWAVMAILAEEGQTTARLRFAAGPRGEFLLPVAIQFSGAFAAAAPEAWAEEYARCVETSTERRRHPDRSSGDNLRGLAGAGSELLPARARRSTLLDDSISEPDLWEFYNE